MVLNMLVQVDQGDLLLTKPTEGVSVRRFPPLRPSVLVLHVPQHREFVQVAQTRAHWASHLLGHLVDHPEHGVFLGRVQISMDLEV